MHRYTHYVIVLGPLGYQVRDPMEKKCSQLKAKEKNNRKTKKNILKPSWFLQGGLTPKVSPDCLHFWIKLNELNDLDRKGERKNDLTRLEHICSQVKSSMNTFWP